MLFNIESHCFFCQTDAINELKCSVCKYSLHFTCSLGFDLTNVKEGVDAANYKCPICLVGSSYELLHRALESHRIQSTEREPSPIRQVRQNTTVLQAYGEITTADDSGDDSGDGSTPVAPAHEQPRAQANNTAVPDTGHGGPQQEADRGGDLPRLKPLDKNCESKMNNLSYILRSLFNNLPPHATTILIGDSLQKGLVKKDLDPNTDSIRIRSVGGLCVVAATQALANHKPKHPKVKKVVFTLGINDHFHQASHKHKPEETNRYLKGLQVEASRVFPNATLHFVLPYKGMVGGDASDFQQTDLLNLIKAKCPKIRCHIPPNLTGKVNDGGVHPSDSGNRALTTWYSKTFIPPATKVFNRNSGRKTQGRPYSKAHIPPDATPTNPVVRQPHGQHRARPSHTEQCSPAPAYSGLADDDPLMLAAGAFTQMLSMWGQQPYTSHFQPPPWLQRLKPV